MSPCVTRFSQIDLIDVYLDKAEFYPRGKIFLTEKRFDKKDEDIFFEKVKINPRVLFRKFKERAEW